MRVPDPVQFRIDQEGHYALSKLVFRRSWLRCFYWLLPLAVLFGLFAIYSKLSVLDTAVPVLAGIVAGAVITGLQRLMLHDRAAKVYQESAMLQELLTLSVNHAVFEFEQESGSLRSLWANMAKWDEDEEIFALFANRQMAYILPKAQIPQELIDFTRERMIASGLPKRGKLRK